MSLVLKLLRRESADAELCKHGSSVGTCHKGDSREVAPCQPSSHRQRDIFVAIAVLSLISAIFLFVSSTFPPHFTVRANRCCWEEEGADVALLHHGELFSTLLGHTPPPARAAQRELIPVDVFQDPLSNFTR